MEFETFFRLSLNIFYIIGLDLQENSPCEKNAEVIKSVLKKCFYWILLTSLIVATILSGIFGVINFSNLTLSAGAVANCCLCSIIVVKCFVTWVMRSSITELVNELKCETESIEYDTDIKELIKIRFRSFDKYQKTNVFVILAAGFIFGIAPVVKLIFDGAWDFKLPHPMWFPFEIHNIYQFLLMYCILELASLSAKGLWMSNDLIINALIVVLSLKFEILAKDLERLDIKSGYVAIKKLVIRHNKLLDTSRKLEETFCVSNFAIFMGSSLLLSFPAFQMVSAEESYTVFKFSFFFIVSMLQTFLICNFGEKLESSSSKVADMVFMCDWSSCSDEETKKALRMILLRAQRPSRLTALKFGNISIGTFSTVSLFSALIFKINIYLRRY